MGYHDIDLSSLRQYDLWWSIEQTAEYMRQSNYGELDIVGYLLDIRWQEASDPERCRQDLARVAHAFLGDAGRDRYMAGSRELDWADEGAPPRCQAFPGDAARQKAFDALDWHNVVFDASISAYREYNDGKVFDRQTCDGFDSLIDDGLVEIDYDYEYNVGVTYRVSITLAGIEHKYQVVLAG